MKFSLHASQRARWRPRVLLLALMFVSQWVPAQDRLMTTGIGSESLDASEHYACAIREDGSLGCWGVMNAQQIEPPAGTFAAVSVGADLACGLRADGELACWGDPVPASPPSGPFVAVAAGRGEACALRPNGALACWGSATASAAPNGSGHVDLSITHGRGCAIRANGSLDCWEAVGVSGYGPVPTGRFIALDVGDVHACGLRSNGQIACWGANQSDQLNVPAGEFLSVTVGGEHSCAIRIEGTLACWGANAEQQLAAPAGRFTAIAAGSSHACARRENGAIVCWGGDGSSGELNPPSGAMNSLLTIGGNGDIVCFSVVGENQSDTDTRCLGDRLDLTPPAQPFTAISLGDNSGCGLLRDGSAQCWGAPLGAIPQGHSFYKISVGGGHACALDQNQNIVCWGDNSFGQAFSPSGSYIDIATGENFTCALRGYSGSSTPRVHCWGAGPAVVNAPVTGEFSELSASGGNVCAFQYYAGAVCWGEAAAALTPPLSGFTKMVVGDNHVCARQGFDSLVCWGSNAQGQLVRPSVESIGALVAAGDTNCITGLQDLVCWGARSHNATLPAGSGRFGTGAIAAGEHHACTLRGSGQARCWGEGDLGQLSVPQGQKRGLTAGGDHTCAIGGGTLGCWGDDTHSGATPVADAVRSAEAGHFNGCAVRGDGEGACWGWNVNGQSSAPAGPFRALATGLNHSCGVRDDGTLVCWGYNADGQTSAPAGAFTSVDVGERHSCAIDSSGGLQCWGLAGEGQTTPPAASGVAYRTLASGAFHNCAIRSDGALACWGRNDRGQATPPEGLFVSVSAGFAHTCAIRDNGARVCWGDNGSGQAPQLAITPQTLPDGVVDAFYDVQLGVQGSGAYVPTALGFAVVAGELPLGIDIADMRPSLLGVPGIPGTYAFTLEVADANGVSGRRDYQMTILPPPDTTPPEIEPVVTGPDGLDFWYRGDVLVQWQVSDPESEVSSTEGCDEVSVVQDTTATGIRFTCIATSAGGTSEHTVVIRRDTQAPETVLLEAPAQQNNYGIDPQRFVLDISDANPGDGYFECTSHPEIPDSFSGPCPSPFVFYSGTLWPWGIPLPGTFTLQFRARDAAGNVDPTPVSYTWTILSDTTPPVITPVLTGTLGDNGWYTSDVSLHWSVVDPETPFIHRSDCPDYTLTFDTRESPQYCEARSWGDFLAYPLTLRRDTGVPTIAPNPQSQPNAAGWYRSAVQVYFSCDDAISGIASCPPLHVLGQEGVAVSTGLRTAHDNAGLVSAPTSYTAKIDMTPPSILAAVTTAPVVAGWYNANVTVAFMCSDALSGLAQACPQNQLLTQEGFSVSSDAWSISDIAGNSATSNVISVKIDRSPPTIAPVFHTQPNANGWYNSNVTVSFDCNDVLSGVAAGECPSSITLAEEGATVTRTASVRDVVGWSASTSLTVKIDRTAPILSVTMPPSLLFLNATHNFNLDATDALSGIASQSCGAMNTGTLGTRSVTCTATDRAGNSASRTATYRVIYDVVPLSAPLNNPGQLYLVEAPRSVPFEWRVRDANGVAITNASLTQTAVTDVVCPDTGIPLPTPPAGETNTFENFGDGRYRRNWWINPTNPISCLRLDVVLNDGITRSATVRIVPKIRRTGGPGQPVPQATSISRPMPASQRVPRAPQPIRRGVKPAKPSAR